MEMDKMKQCVHCEERFVSNNKLFQHLVASHGVERDSIHSVRPGKIILLVGWLSQNSSDEEKGWEMDGHLSHAWTINEDRVERELFHAIDQVDGVNISFAELEEQRKTLSSTRGLSRASSCAQRASHLLQIEKTSHSVTDAFCFQIPGKSKPKNQEWIASVNALLPNDIRVIEVYNLPSSYTEFHAEAGCSQRVYEYVLPLRILFPPFMMETGAGGGDEESDHEIKLENRKVKEKVWCKMDAAFPRDTPQALKRIENFRRLKILLKLFCGKNSYHNFITGGASPEDGHVKRRVDRFYHKEMLSILYHKQNNNSSTGRSDGSDEITISDICHDPFYNNTDATETNQDSSTLSSSSVPIDSPISEDWAVLSLSGNTFLKGQPRRMIGLAIAVMWGWLPLSFIEAALDPQNIVNLPAVPGCGLYLSECRYDKWEAKSEDWRFDPRRVVGADLTSLNNWTRVVQTYAVKSMVKNGFYWMEEMKSQCEIFLLRYETERSLRLRSPEDLLRRIESPEGECCGIPTTLPSEVYNAYETVLRLLREADASGQWPLSSQARQKIISEETLQEKGAKGGTFSVGFLPPPLVQPRGNDLFPDLLLACFRLEKILYPSRKPSSTIAINKHAQFLPHRDSGAGTGQDLSLIVGLGDYSGGEIMIETIPSDIRYKPIEFNGWLDRHWTLPFQGERYSLVWFTPISVRIPEDLWWLEQL